MDDAYFSKAYKIMSDAIQKRSGRNRLLSEDVLMLVRLLGYKPEAKCLIPNLNLGELCLCADSADAYSSSSDVAEILQTTANQNRINLIQDDFLKASVVEKYSSVLLFPVYGVHLEQGRSEILYVEKSLRLLDKDGTAVIILPQNMLTAPCFRPMRNLIMSKYSLEAVFYIDRKIFVWGEASILLIKHRKQCNKIFMRGSNDNRCYRESARDIYDEYKNYNNQLDTSSNCFYIKVNEIYDRIDPDFYAPKYKENRDLILRRDTVKLRDIANIYNGYFINSDDRKSTGDYLIIKPKNIKNGEITFENDVKTYCTKGAIDSNRQNGLLKNGDIVVSSFGESNWAIYQGEDDRAIVNQHVYIVRGKRGQKEWLEHFFKTNTGKDSLKNQLNFLSNVSGNHIPSRMIGDIYVPDFNVLKKTLDQVNNAIDTEGKIVNAFKSLGWIVKEGYQNHNFCYDIALFEGNFLKAVVDVKRYSLENIKNNTQFLKHINLLKKNLNDTSVYLFVNNDIYEYLEDELVQLPELPRPGKKSSKNIKQVEEIDTDDLIKVIKASDDEVSLTDRALLEQILSTLNRVEKKVDELAIKIEKLSNQILGCQSLVDKLIKTACSPEEVERIIHAFSNECVEKIVCEVKENNAEQEYKQEKDKLIKSLGENAWNKMDLASKNFLVSSKVIYNKLLALQDIIDYSGVCLLVTKALEVELGNRFCKNFVNYLITNYNDNYELYHTSLIKIEKQDDGKDVTAPISQKDFTLGSVPYVLCLKKGRISDEQKKKNEEKLIEFSKSELFPDKSNEEIKKLLKEYAKKVAKVTDKYRNPSAHTNEIGRFDARDCFDLVLDVEKLLKKMLDSFNK